MSPAIVGKTHEHAGERQTDESSVLGLPEAPPFEILQLMIDRLRQAERTFHVTEAVQPEEGRMNSGDERGKSGGRHPGELGKRLEIVVGMVGAGARWIS